MFKCKISESDVTHGPWEPDEFEAWFIAADLTAKGYRKVSNAYCSVARIDRDDWLTVLARVRNCSIADFYNVDGSGIADRHRDHYVRVHSKDSLTVSPHVLRLMKSY